MAKSLTLILLSDKAPKLGAAALAAAREISPHASIRHFETAEKAIASPPSAGLEIFLVSATDPDAAHIANATDESSLPRWGLVFLERSTQPDQIALPLEEWSHHAIVRAFQAALIQLKLERQLARARGDLKTVSRRLTHDLRSHVGGILTTAEALRETISEDSRPAQFKPLIHATEETMDLIDRISFVIRASAIPKPAEALDMGMACWAAIQRLETEILKKAVALVQPNSWPAVEGVGSWTEVVWLNLLANSLYQRGSDSRIEIGWEARDKKEADDEALFWVEDSGPGVPDEKRALLFHPFHLLHQTNAPNGLGLPIVRRLVELQGGHCSYRRVNDRTRFCFTLPLAEAGEASRTEVRPK